MFPILVTFISKFVHEQVGNSDITGLQYAHRIWLRYRWCFYFVSELSHDMNSYSSLKKEICILKDIAQSDRFIIDKMMSEKPIFLSCTIIILITLETDEERRFMYNIFQKIWNMWNKIQTLWWKTVDTKWKRPSELPLPKTTSKVPFRLTCYKFRSNKYSLLLRVKSM